MEIERLVEKGKIKGRIDLIDQVCPLNGAQDVTS